MSIIIKSENLEVTPAIRSYAEEKLGTVFDHLAKDSTRSLEVDLGITSKHHKQGDMFMAKALLSMGSKKIHLESITDDMYKSIDELKNKLADEIAHNNDKKRSMLRTAARKFKDFIKRK